MSELTAPGPWRVGARVTVDPEHVARFAAAVGEVDPDLLAGRACPPTYPVVLGWRQQNAALDGVLPNDVLGLHGEQAFRYHAPLVPGTVVVTRSRLEGVIPRRTGTTVTARTEILDDRDDLVCSQLFTVFVVGRQLPEAGDRGAALGHEPDPGGDLPVLGEVVETMHRDQPRRYSEASGDTYPIHLDDEFARSMGLPGVIAHGLCTLAFAARAVRDLVTTAGKPGLTHLSARFSAPVFPMDDVRTVVAGGPGADGLVGSFTTSVDGRGEVITSGRFRAVGADAAHDATRPRTTAPAR